MDQPRDPPAPKAAGPWTAALLATLAACGLGASPSRTFTLDDADRLREPFHVLLSPDGRSVVYALGDTLWIRDLVTDEPGSPLSAGMTSVSSQGDPFMAWSPASDALVFQADPEGAASTDALAARVYVAERSDSWTVRPLLPDSVAGKLRPINMGNMGPAISFRRGGPSWSPDGRRLAFYAWRAEEETWPKLFVTDVVEGRVEQRTDGSVLGAGVAWSPEARWLAVTRDDDGTGVLELTSPGSAPVAGRYSDEGVLGDLRWSPDGRKIFIASNRSRQFVLHVGDDGAIRPGAELPPATYAGWVPTGDALFASQRVGMSSRLILVDATSGTVRPLSSENEVRVAIGIGGDAAAPIVAYTAETGSEPKDVWVANLDAAKQVLLRPRRVVDAHRWLDSVALARVRIFRWSAPDSTLLEAQLFLPPEGVVRAGEPTPLVIIPYGGFANTFPSGDDLMTRGIQALAARGWAVVRPNTRGIFGQRQTDGYGATQMEDTHRLLDALIAERLVDARRVAVFGHSHGGAMAYYYLTHSDRFAGVIAVNGPADWVAQARRRDMTGLPWGLGGTPDELPAKYEAYSPLANAERVEAPLLAVAAQGDTQIPPDQAREMVERLSSLGKTAELLWLPEEDHFIRRPENRDLLWNRVIGFLDGVFGPPEP